jgi:pimeloyl-ACP methyl ester carboxylesterase
MEEVAMTAPTTQPEVTTQTLETPTAVLAYDVRAGSPAARPLLLIGSPMGATGFGTLASHFTDRTVITYDPRGVERSARKDGAPGGTPDEHADDLHRLIDSLGLGPVDLFATSGGAVNALALVAGHPEQVRILVAHEPPSATLLADRDPALAACQDIHDTYFRSGMGAAMAKFIAVVSLKGAVPADFATRPAPDPAMFGLPTEDDGSRNDPMLGEHILAVTSYEPDFDALRAATTRIVIAVGAESEGELAHRGGLAVAERLGTAPVTFPSGHAGFLGGEYGQMGDPDAFAARLREILDSDA